MFLTQLGKQNSSWIQPAILFQFLRDNIIIYVVQICRKNFDKTKESDTKFRNTLWPFSWRVQ